MISESSFFDASGFCVSILKGQVSFLAGTDFDNIFNIVNEYFSITETVLEQPKEDTETPC